MGMAVTTALAEVERDLYRADGKRPPLFLRDGDRKKAAAAARAPAAVPMGPAMERLARALKARRAELGLTQTDLATRARISRSRVQTIETMTHAATLDTLDRLAEALDCDVVELLGGRAG